MQAERVYEVVRIPRHVTVRLGRVLRRSFRLPWIRRKVRRVGYRGYGEAGRMVECLDYTELGDEPDWARLEAEWRLAARRRGGMVE